MWHQVKLQYYIYYFKNLLLELLKITQEGGGSKIFGTGKGVNFENEKSMGVILL